MFSFLSFGNKAAWRKSGKWGRFSQVLLSIAVAARQFDLDGDSVDIASDASRSAVTLVYYRTLSVLGTVTGKTSTADTSKSCNWKPRTRNVLVRLASVPSRTPYGEMKRHRTLGITRSFCDLFVWGERKTSSRSSSGKFPTVRDRKPTTGILVSASKQKRKHTAVHSRFPTVSSFSLASLHTSRTIRV